MDIKVTIFLDAATCRLLVKPESFTMKLEPSGSSGTLQHIFRITWWQILGKPQIKNPNNLSHSKIFLSILIQKYIRNCIQ